MFCAAEDVISRVEVEYEANDQRKFSRKRSIAHKDNVCYLNQTNWCLKFEICILKYYNVCRFSPLGMSSEARARPILISRILAQFAISAIGVPSIRPRSDTKPKSARLDRPPLISSAGNHSHSESQLLNAATTKCIKAERHEDFLSSCEESLTESQLDSPFQAGETKTMTTSSEENFPPETLWTRRLNGGDRAPQGHVSKHFNSDTEKDLTNIQVLLREAIVPDVKVDAEVQDTVGETSGDRYLSRGSVHCHFFQEIIDVEREAGFGEDEDFGDRKEQAMSKLRDSTEGKPSDDEELPLYERYRQPRFHSGEDFPTSRVQLRLGGRDNSLWMENAAEAAGQGEVGHLQDVGNKGLTHGNSTGCKWLTLSPNHEEERLAPSHMDFWEEERWKAQLEEEIRAWKGNNRRMEHPLRGNHTSDALDVRNNSEHINHVVRDMLAELRLEEVVLSEANDAARGKHLRPSFFLPETQGNSCKLMVMAFEELLREVEATASKNRKKLDDVLRAQEEEAESMQEERRTWLETEEQLRSRIRSLEIQCGRMSDMLRETAAALTVEKERRKDSQCELDKVTERLIKEKKLHRETAEKLNTYISSCTELRDILDKKKLTGEDADSAYLESIQSVINDMDREINCNFSHATQISDKIIQSGSDLLYIDELNRLKQQREAAEAERDLIEERLSTLLRETREGHGEMEALWLEREKLLEQKIGCLETELHHLHCRSKRKEAEVMIERQRSADELAKSKHAWAGERKAWVLENRMGALCRWMEDADDRRIRRCAQESVEGCGKLVMKPTSTTEHVHGAAHLELHDQHVDAGSLVLGMEEAMEIHCDDEKMVIQREKTEEWRRLAEQYKQERKETEKKLSASLILVSKLEADIETKEIKMEEERKEIEGQLANKSVEVEKLKQSLKSKERDLEITIQKFTDELQLIDKEVERERKEREQVMELHFASKRQLVSDIKTKEESWEKALEVRNNELQSSEHQLKIKQRVVEELQLKVEEEKTLRERTAQELEKEKTVVRKEMEEMLADIWRLCEEEKIQAAVSKELLPGGDLSLRRPMWESLWLEYCRTQEISDDAKVFTSNLEWEFARGKVAHFEKQVTEAMSAIKGLRDEVKAKEEQLLKIKGDREREWEQREEDWAQERGRLLNLVDTLQRKEVQLNEERQSREKEYAKKMKAMEELRKIEKEEAAVIISSLRGTARELEWCLKSTSTSRRLKFPRESNKRRESIYDQPDENNELVQVHASYLEELDRYIFDLENRKEAGGRSSIYEKTALEGGAHESANRECDTDIDLMQLENDLPTTSGLDSDMTPMLGVDDDGRLSPRVSREWSSPPGGLGTSMATVSRQRVARPMERGMCLTLNGLHTFTQQSHWSEEVDGNLPVWQLESHKSWMSEEMQSYPGSPPRDHRALAAPSTQRRRPQKWLVDVSWMEQVRKEHAWLRKQLEIERQRVSALGRVEADNRWIQAAIIRALELKRESDTKVAEMQRKLAAMETWFSIGKV